MLDIHWLNTFATLARLQHFGQTATELHMTQPNVSLHIKNLERATRVKLIERNPFRLTQAGERLLLSAENTLRELQLCQSDLNALGDFSQGTLAIAASDIISRLLLIRPFQLFKQQFPGIDLTLYNTTSDQAAELVRSGKADLGFVLAQKRSEPLHFTPLQPVQWCALGQNSAMLREAPMLPDAVTATQTAESQSPQRLEGRLDSASVSSTDTATSECPTLILLGHDTRTRALIDSALHQLSLPTYRVMEVGSVDAQIDWAEAGFGTAIVPSFSLRPQRQLTSPTAALPHFPGTRLGYIVRQNQILSRAIKQLLQWVDEEINQDITLTR
ncbi:MAG: LysR family transcriptional regulator [Plesiomonas shigelloides]